MSNSPDAAARWTRYLASRSYVPRAPLIQQHFASGKISRLCDCGCQSFDLAIEPDVALEPLMPGSGRGGCALALGYYALGDPQRRATVDVRVFVDARGYLSGIDVDYCGNSAPMPEHVVLVDPPFHLHGVLLDMTSNKRSSGP